MESKVNNIDNMEKLTAEKVSKIVQEEAEMKI